MVLELSQLVQAQVATLTAQGKAHTDSLAHTHRHLKTHRQEQMQRAQCALGNTGYGYHYTLAGDDKSWLVDHK